MASNIINVRVINVESLTGLIDRPLLQSVHREASPSETLLNPLSIQIKVGRKCEGRLPV